MDQIDWLELLWRLGDNYGGKLLICWRVGPACAFGALLSGHIFKSEIEYIFRLKYMLGYFSVSKSATFAVVSFEVMSSSSGIS